MNKNYFFGVIISLAIFSLMISLNTSDAFGLNVTSDSDNFIYGILVSNQINEDKLVPIICYTSNPNISFLAVMYTTNFYTQSSILETDGIYYYYKELVPFSLLDDNQRVSCTFFTFDDEIGTVRLATDSKYLDSHSKPINESTENWVYPITIPVDTFNDFINNNWMVLKDRGTMEHSIKHSGGSLFFDHDDKRGKNIIVTKIDISSADDTTPLIISFDYRLISDDKDASQFNIKIKNEHNSKVMFSKIVRAGDTDDTKWQTFTTVLGTSGKKGISNFDELNISFIIKSLNKNDNNIRLYLDNIELRQLYDWNKVS